MAASALDVRTLAIVTAIGGALDSRDEPTAARLAQALGHIWVVGGRYRAGWSLAAVVPLVAARANWTQAEKLARIVLQAAEEQSAAVSVSSGKEPGGEQA